MKKIAASILVFSVIGFGISFYLYLLHIGSAESAICQINATFDCQTVENSPYSLTFGIPNSILGMIGYGLMTLGALMKLLQKKHDAGTNLFLLLAALGGLGFSLYLTGIEAFVLQAWCIFCIASQVVMLVVFGLVVTLFIQDKPANKPTETDKGSDEE